MNARLMILALSTCAVVSPAFAGAPPEDLLRRELRDAVARVLASDAFAGQPTGAVALTVTLPAERYLDLGLLVDPREPATDGLRVLGTSPGGAAQQLGLRAGDVVTRVGERSLAGLGADADGTARAVGVFRGTVESLADGAPLGLDVRRDGRTLRIDGTVQPRYLPAVRLELGEGNLVASSGAAAAASVAAGTGAAADGGCGRISTFHVAPRSQSLYGARVLSIDGRIPGPADQDTYRVAPGPHTVEVAEAIDAQDLPTAFSRRRADLGRRTFTVVVEPGRTHLVAAHLTDGRGVREYWEPVVWKTLDEECR
jgi:hypothetical protein